MNRILLAFALLFVAASASATILEVHLTPLVSGEMLTIDLGNPVESIIMCSIRFTGSSEPKEISCDSPGGQAVYYEPYYFTGSFMENQLVVGSGFNNYLGSGAFDILYTFTTEDWSFLSADGISGLKINWGRVEGGGYNGFCMTQAPGYLTYENVTLTIEYVEVVSNRTSSWGAVKSVYR